MYSQEHSEYVIKKTTLTAIADSVRAKTGKTDPLDPDDIPAEIESITTGINPTGTKDITENGEHDVTNYTKANVNVPIPEDYIKPTGTKDITENGEHDVTAYEKVNVEFPKYDGSMQTETTSGQEKYVLIDKPDISVSIAVEATFYSMSLYWGAISIVPDYGIVYVNGSDPNNQVTVYTPEGGWVDEGYKTIYPRTMENSSNAYLFKGWRADNSEGNASVSLTYNGITSEIKAGNTVTISCAGKEMTSDVVITRV